MEPRLILKNLDNGTITQDAATDLLIEHAPQAYLVGAYLCTREQRDDYRKQVYDLQDAKPRAVMSFKAITDLIDHALATGYIMSGRAKIQLIEAGMDPDTAQHHVDTVNVITDRDLERADYLDDPENAPRWCTRCGRKVTAEKLSNRSICKLCSADAQEENIAQLRRKAGPLYTRWRNAMLVWAYTLEDQEIAERHPIDAGTLGDYIEDDTIEAWDICKGNCASCDVANCPDRDCDYCAPPALKTPWEDFIDHDKKPGCDAECDLCHDPDCPFRDTPMKPDVEETQF